MSREIGMAPNVTVATVTDDEAVGGGEEGIERVTYPAQSAVLELTTPPLIF